MSGCNILGIVIIAVLILIALYFLSNTDMMSDNKDDTVEGYMGYGRGGYWHGNRWYGHHGYPHRRGYYNYYNYPYYNTYGYYNNYPYNYYYKYNY